MAAAVPLQQAQPSFLAAVRAFCKLIYQTKTVDEAKAATYLFEHTICYQEFDRAKRITLDEFAHGRRRKDRTRLDDGCGVKQRSHVSEALTRMQERQLVTVLADEQDRARIRKSYALNLDCSGKRNTSEEEAPIIDIQAQTVPESGTQSSGKRNTGFRKAEHRVPEAGTRSGEGLGGSASSRYLEESTLYAADAAVDAVVSVEPVEEEDAPMSPAAPVTSDDGYPFKPLQMPSKADRLRSKLQKERQQPTLLEVSDSQAQEPSHEALYEKKEEAPAEPENEELRYYRELLIKQQRTLKDEEDYLGLCDPSSKPEVERNIEMYRAAVISTEKTILDLQPAPALDDSNWQQQLFGGLCRLAGASPERISGTPLAKTLGQAAGKIKAHKRRPDELQSMWQRFRTDARFRWMNGRGDTGKLMMLFAQNAAVL